MSVLLVATLPLAGHVRPMGVLVRALYERGHSVHWYTGHKFRHEVQAAGARFVPLRACGDFDDADVEAALPALRGRSGLSRVRAQLEGMFIEPLGAQLADLEAAIYEVQPDALLSEPQHLGAAAASEKHRLPWISLGVSPLIVPSLDTAPFGSALPPARSAVDRVRNRALYWFVQRVLFRSVERSYRRARARAGLPDNAASYFEVLGRDLHLQPAVEAFEYPRRDLPCQVRFIGPLRDAGGPEAGASDPAAWHAALGQARTRQRPLVLVTQGTLSTNPRELIVPAVAALADEPVSVLAITRANLGMAGLSVLPANAHVVSYAPYEALLPHAAAMITNAGFNGVQLALAHGVPVVAAGAGEDKPEVAARVAWSGLGLDLRTGRPSPRALRGALRQLLAEPRFAARARELATLAAESGGAQRGATQIEALLSSP